MLAGTTFRPSMSVDADRVVVVGDVVVANDMSLAVNLDGVVGRDRRGIRDSCPTVNPVAVMHSDHGVVGNVEVIGFGPVRHHALADFVHLAIHHGKPGAAQYPFEPCVKGDLRVDDRESFEVVVIGSHHIEQAIVAFPIKDHFAVAGRLNGDGTLRRAVLSEHVGSVKIES